MKYEGNLHNMPVYSDPECPPDTLYFINDKYTIEHPLRKDGKPDMRYGINKLEKMFQDMYFPSERG